MVLRPGPRHLDFLDYLNAGMTSLGQDRETPLHALGRDEPAGVELGDDAVEAQLLAAAA